MRDITPFSGGPPAEEHVDGKDPQDLFLGDQWKSEIREQTMLTEKLDDRDSAGCDLHDCSGRRSEYATGSFFDLH